MSGAPNPLTELLRPHVAALVAAVRAGDAKAERVIDLYQLHVRCPSDPGAPALCRCAFEDWQRSLPTPTETPS